MWVLNVAQHLDLCSVLLVCPRAYRLIEDLDSGGVPVNFAEEHSAARTTAEQVGPFVETISRIAQHCQVHPHCRCSRCPNGFGAAVLLAAFVLLSLSRDECSGCIIDRKSFIGVISAHHFFDYFFS